MKRPSIPLFLWLTLLLASGLVWALGVGGMASQVLALLSLLIGLIPVMRRGRILTGSTPNQVDLAKTALSREIIRRWDGEAHVRDLHRGDMRIPWKLISGKALPATGSEGFAPKLVTAFAARPSQLVIIGDAGSGKTSVALLLLLETARHQTTPWVPVLLDLSSWDPGERMRSYLIRRIAEDYPFLTSPSAYGRAAVSALVDGGRILPILDGLDEMTEGRRTAALAALREEWAYAWPFVMTCRSEEFFAAHGPELLRDITVVQLLPLAPAAVADFVLHRSVVRNNWWPVLEMLVNDPDHPGGLVLTNPLYLYLARREYDGPDKDPTELLDPGRFPTRQDAENHLLRTFVPMAFNRRGWHMFWGRRWDPERAERWLVYIATYLNIRHTRNLAWWELHHALPAFVMEFAGSVFSGAGGNVAQAETLPRTGRRLRAGPRRPNRRIVLKQLLVTAGLCGGAAAVGAIAGGWDGVTGGLAVGIVGGVASGLAQAVGVTAAGDDSPGESIRRDRRVALMAGGAGAVFGGLVGVLLGASSLGLSGGIVIGGLTALMGTAWGRFQPSRAWLAITGRLPWALVTFLRDAHRLGVLRQVGAVYQFRHIRLQEVLGAREW